MNIVGQKGLPDYRYWGGKQGEALIRPPVFSEFQKEETEQAVSSRFEQKVTQYGDRIAIRSEGTETTYNQLNAAANSIARAIVARDYAPSKPVILLLDHDVNEIAAVLATFKAGKICVPLQPDWDPPRAANILADTQAQLLITDSNNFSRALTLADKACVIINVDEIDATGREDNLQRQISPDDFAYILYTSGSTGQPKGVVQSHRNLLHDLRGYTNCFQISTDDRFTLFAPCSGAQGIKTALSALVNGATLCLWDIKQRGLAASADWLIEENITIYISTPMIFRNFVSTLSGTEEFPQIRLIKLGSEPLHKEDVDLYKKYFSPQCVLLNWFSSTETGNVCYNFIDKKTEFLADIVPLGIPHADKEILLIDDLRRPVGVDQIGEIAVKSRYLPIGYWGRPDLTTAKFIPDPAGGDERICLTGDLGLIHADGRLEYIGRKDARVKICGFAVDVKEIEAVLRKLPNVKDAVVQALGDSAEKRLIAYIVCAKYPRPTMTELHRCLRMNLSAHMVPSRFVFLDSLPLTPNGKVDRRALPAPDLNRPDLDQDFVAPESPVEKVIAAIWAETLKLSGVGIHDNFFDLGGNSLLAIKIISQLRNNFSVDLPVRILFDEPTIAHLANRLENLTKAAGSSTRNASYSHLLELSSGPNRRPIFCFPYRCGVQGEYTHFLRLARYMGSDNSLYGLQAKATDTDTPSHTTIEELVTNYVREIEDFQPNGPYYLIGDCAGAIEAYETARQLWLQGKEIGLLILLDARGPYLANRYWRIGPYSLRDLDRLRIALMRSRLGMWCSDFAAAISFHLKQSAELPKRERWHFLVTKALEWTTSRFGTSRDGSSVRHQEPENALTEKEDHLLKDIDLARKRYRSNWPSNYGGRLTVIVNKQWFGFDRTFGWAGMASGGVEIHSIPGDHISYMLEHVSLVADELRACLEKARNEM